MDFCQTIVSIDSLPCFIKYVCLKKKGWRTVKYIWYWLLNRLGKTIKKSDRIALLAKISASDLEKISQAFSQKILLPSINRKVITYINNKKIKGDKVIIVSAALGNYIDPISDYLKSDKVIAARLELDEKGFTTGRLNQPLIYGKKKVVEIGYYIEQIKASGLGSCAISDSIHDLPMLEWSDEPVVIEGVCPTLTCLAKEREWALL